jgi:hypothetical protein
MTEMMVLTTATGAETTARSLKRETPRTAKREIAIEGEAKARRELTNGARCEVEKVESGVEELVEETHEAQHCPVGVVDVHDRVLVHVDELVGCFALQNRPRNPQISEGLPPALGLHLRVKVKPMTRHIDRHRQLEPEHVFGVEVAECHEKSHRSTPVRQLIQHRAELRG